MNVLRIIGLRLLGIAHWSDDLRLLGAALIDIQKRTRNLEARINEFTVGAPAETGGDR